MKPEIIYLVTADHALIESNNKPSIIGIFNNIYLTGNKTSVTLPQMYVFARIANAKGVKDVEVTIYDPKGEKFGDSVKLSYKGTDNLPTIQLKALFTIRQFKEIGKYTIRIKLDGVEVPTNDFHSFSLVKKDA